MLRYLPLLLLLPAVATAQTAEVVAKVEAKLDAERAAQRNEDVEILRRLLNKAVGLPDKVHVTAEPPGRAHPNDPAPSMSMMTDQYLPVWQERMKEWNARNPLLPGSTKVTAPVGPFDGVYLPGAGVVFTLHVPSGAGVVADGSRLGLNQSCVVCHAGITARDRHHASSVVHQCSTCHDAAVTPPTPLSDWERVRSDVRGERPKATDPTPKKEEKPRAAVCEPGNLQTLITGVLAANAKNVRHLPEKEGVTVVVTFDELKPTGRVWKGTSYYEPVETVEKGQPVTKYELRTKEEWVDTDAPPTHPLAGGKAFTPGEVKSLALGDLHLKQGKYKEATEAYGEGLARFWQKPFKVSAPPTLTAEQKNAYAEELQKGVRDAMKNYAKALLLADQPERAKEALEMATGFVVLEVTPTTVPPSPTAPAKLIVSVTRADIAAAKDAAALKKAVRVEQVNFPSEGKK